MAVSMGERMPAGPVSRAGRHPLTVFSLFAFALGWTGLAVPLAVGLPLPPFLLILVFVALLGSALLVTRWADGPGAVRRLLARLLRWRFSSGRWAVILFGLPTVTVVLAAVSGTLSTPAEGWIAELGWYLFGTLIFGALAMNLWEETAWAGFVQTRLMARHGLMTASMITAVMFGAIHIPLSFAPGWTWSSVGFGLAALFVAAPFYRYLIGLHLLDTRGSLLAVGIQHASWNATQQLDAVDGGTTNWQALAATILLTVGLALVHRRRSPGSRKERVDSEKAAAAAWFEPVTAVQASSGGVSTPVGVPRTVH
jgi:membrane protease YdiL (CAAX protease family)